MWAKTSWVFKSTVCMVLRAPTHEELAVAMRFSPPDGNALSVDVEDRVHLLEILNPVLGELSTFHLDVEQPQLTLDACDDGVALLTSQKHARMADLAQGR